MSKATTEQAKTISKELGLSDTFCPLPWMHLHSWPDGKAMLCCIASAADDKTGGKVGDFSKNTYGEIINNDVMKQTRLDMLEGKTIRNCENCNNDEKFGRSSFRHSMIKDFKEYIPTVLSPDYTAEDGTLKDPKMFYMDFRFSNLCNLGCQTCGWQLSSNLAKKQGFDWPGGQRVFRDLQQRGVLSERETITSFVYARPDFFETDVLPYIDETKTFYFAGGEPLMHQEHLDILNYLNDNKMYDVRLVYSTNLTLLKWKKTDFLDLWKNFKSIYFLGSIDGDNERLEYIRENSNHRNVFDNLKKLIAFKNEKPHERHEIRINICYTHSIYNCYYTREFFKALIDEGVLEHLNHVEFNCSYGDRNSTAILPDFAKKELIEKMKEDAESEELKRTFELFPSVKTNFESIYKVMYEELPEGEFDRLVHATLNKDSERIKTAIPWLHSVVKRHTII